MKKSLALLPGALLCLSGCGSNNADIVTTAKISEQTIVTTESATEKIEPDYSEFTYTVYTDSVTIKKYNGSEKNIVIPAEIENKSVKKFAPGFISEKDIEEITFSEGITDIPAFKDCDSLKIINLPSIKVVRL